MPERRLRRLVAAKKIPVHRDGRLGFWSVDLEEWIERHRTPALNEPKSKHLELAAAIPQSMGIEDLMPTRRRLSAARSTASRLER
jgi:hypothetical protein